MSDVREAPPLLVESEGALGALVGRVASEPRLALDTEANSLHAYRERVCVVQLSAPGVDAIVDPLAVPDLEPLRRARRSRRRRGRLPRRRLRRLGPLARPRLRLSTRLRHDDRGDVPRRAGARADGARREGVRRPSLEEVPDGRLGPPTLLRRAHRLPAGRHAAPARALVAPSGPPRHGRPRRGGRHRIRAGSPPAGARRGRTTPTRGARRRARRSSTRAGARSSRRSGRGARPARARTTSRASASFPTRR